MPKINYWLMVIKIIEFLPTIYWNVRNVRNFKCPDVFSCMMHMFNDPPTPTLPPHQSNRVFVITWLSVTLNLVAPFKSYSCFFYCYKSKLCQILFFTVRPKLFSKVVDFWKRISWAFYSQDLNSSSPDWLLHIFYRVIWEDLVFNPTISQSCYLSVFITHQVIKVLINKG